jgi:sulfite exporter TauE/SafE
MQAPLYEAFVLGLSMGPACLGYCAPVFVPLVASGKQSNWAGTARVVGVFLAGRLAGYTLVGTAVGVAGAVLLHNVSPAVWGAVRVCMGILMIAFGILNNPTGTRWCAHRITAGSSTWVSTALGLLTGLNLCPPFAAAITGAAETASVTSALLYFWAFFAGTAIYFAPFVFISPLKRMEPFRQVTRVCLFLAGFWLILEGGLEMIRFHFPG